MGHITLNLKDETLASLRKDFDAFLRVSLKLDPQFATPEFEDYLRTVNNLWGSEIRFGAVTCVSGSNAGMVGMVRRRCSTRG